jgi:hypothetical protein
MFSWISNKVYSFLAIAAGVLGVLFYAFQQGKADQRLKQKTKELESYKETRERIDETPVNTNRDDALERLRKSGQVR